MHSKSPTANFSPDNSSSGLGIRFLWRTSWRRPPKPRLRSLAAESIKNESLRHRGFPNHPQPQWGFNHQIWGYAMLWLSTCFCSPIKTSKKHGVNMCETRDFMWFLCTFCVAGGLKSACFINWNHIWLAYFQDVSYHWYWVPALRRIDPQKGVSITCGLWGKLCRKQTCDCYCSKECVVALQERFECEEINHCVCCCFRWWNDVC